MASVIGLISNKFSEIVQNRDTRLDHLPFTSPSSLVLVLVSYVYFVKRYGPSYMGKREPFALQTTIIIYNLIQIVLNSAYVLHTVHYWWTHKPYFNFACQPIDWGSNVLAITEAKTVYYFHCLKLLDLCDTVFFVLKKNARQISFLHVYHHVAVLTLSYRCLAWSPGGQFIIIGTVNSFVHAIMYTYYLFSVFEPQLKENVTIKRGVTTIQMIQFLILITYFVGPLCNPDCPLFKPYVLELILQNVFLLYLFGNFYYRTYCVKKVQKCK
ncbi:elongation of very long chain fatty acids protein AAEL008004-like [Bradysia coprophila]|uniref:elongation of very long chain fatty acids protein AAEL008004-like n=1 Tax=Bradysia coprophila TaxID=38358 RepID=UPI00187DD9B4|nr:elongation of very long chain fatty acids protein AAEL008004-like [Bradysia coprophila]